jgi:MSHA biogenesis protein MshK
MKRLLNVRQWAALVLIAAAVAPARAQIEKDPTRPPAGMPGSDTDIAATHAPILQSVRIAPGQRSAIIGGETVTVGGKYGEARVVAITESEVVLQSGSIKETLRMYPGIEIKPVVPPPAAAAKPAAKKRAPTARNRGKQG